MEEFSENRHISNLVNMSCKVTPNLQRKREELYKLKSCNRICLKYKHYKRFAKSCPKYLTRLIYSNYHFTVNFHCKFAWAQHQDNKVDRLKISKYVMRTQCLPAQNFLTKSRDNIM